MFLQSTSMATNICISLNLTSQLSSPSTFMHLSAHRQSIFSPSLFYLSHTVLCAHFCEGCSLKKTENCHAHQYDAAQCKHTAFYLHTQDTGSYCSRVSESYWGMAWKKLKQSCGKEIPIARVLRFFKLQRHYCTEKVLMIENRPGFCEQCNILIN